MIEGWKGGPVPGAIALLGGDSQLAASFLAMEAQSRHLHGGTLRDDEKNLPHLAPPVPLEWPPLVLFLASDDPQRGECAQACRRMRALGIPARLEVIETLSNTETSELGETGLVVLAAELHGFFASHLVADFPRVF